jgi:hypothetical protein
MSKMIADGFVRLASLMFRGCEQWIKIVEASVNGGHGFNTFFWISEGRIVSETDR